MLFWGKFLISIYDFNIRNVKKWTCKYEFSVSTHCYKNKASAYIQNVHIIFLHTTTLTSFNLYLLLKSVSKADCVINKNSTKIKFVYYNKHFKGYCHGEKPSKHFEQYGSHDDSSHFDGIGQFTETFTRLRSMN